MVVVFKQRSGGMVDTADLKSAISNNVWVRLPSSLPRGVFKGKLK